jgi:hypothetical protein
MGELMLYLKIYWKNFYSQDILDVMRWENEEADKMDGNQGKEVNLGGCQTDKMECVCLCIDAGKAMAAVIKP